ncbi:MAG: lipopolysaccharide biosynthesis protein [Bacteroidales bacterium]|nr:lipopolysaccharide biosynthesis protein [Bacteroidales bacterium]MCF8360358.1 lipopolysaccharide biosynthesis protein [Prolixibacteraceae bacterium]
MSSEEIKKKPTAEEDEIDLIALARTLWDERRAVIKTVIIFTILGFFIAIFSPKEYTATTTMVPQINSPSAKMGGLSSLASLAGFNLDMNIGGNELSPMLYPQIVSSISFQLEIMNTKYRFEELKEEVSLYDYYLNYFKPNVFSVIKKYTIGLPGVILKAIRGAEEEIPVKSESETLRITKDQDKIRKIIQEKLTLNINDKDGYITLNSHFHEAELSAQVAQKAQKLLQDYITQFKIEKATAQFHFIEERYNEKKREFETAQRRLASYRDANKNITSATARTEEERLENEYQLAFEVYSELAKQLEQARIQVKEDTPVFSVIEEVSVPVEKSKPKRSLILVIWIFLGGILGIGIVFTKTFSKEIQGRWREKSKQ